jgi:hypothetical protein
MERKQALIAVAVFLIALAPRVYYMNAGLFHTDSVIEAIAVEKTYNTRSLNYMHDPGYPGQVVVVTIVYAIQRLLGGPESAEYAATFASALMGALGVVAAYFFVREYLESEKAALFSALILTVFPVYLSISTYAKDHTTEVFFLLAGAYFAVKARKKSSLKLTAAASMLVGYAVGVRIVNLMFYPLFLLLLWEGRFPLKHVMEDGVYKIKPARKIRDLTTELAAAIIPSLLVFLALYAKMFTTRGITPLFTVSEYAGFLGLFSNVLPLSIKWATFSLTQAGWVFAALGLILLARKSPYKSALILLWFLMYFLYGGNLRITTPRYVIPGLVPLTFLIGYLASEVYARVNKLFAVACILILAGVMFHAIQPLLEYRKDFCGPKEFSLNVRKTTEPNAVIITMDESYHIQYYGNRSIMTHPIDGDPQKIADNMGKIRDLLDDGVPLYLSSTAFSYDVAGDLKYDVKTGLIMDSNTGKPYNKVIFDPNSKTIKQTETGAVLPLTGRWMLELFQNYKVVYIGSFENEDWHRNVIIDGRFKEHLFKIEEF